MYGRLLDVFQQERSHRCQKSVGRWLLIYTAHYSVTLKVVFIKESVAELTGKLMLEDIAYQQSAEHGAAALVAQDVSKRAYVILYLMPVVVARVGAGAEYTGNTFVVRKARVRLQEGRSELRWLQHSDSDG